MAQPIARADVPVAHRWDDVSLFADLAAWDAEHDAVAAELPAIAALRGTLNSGPEPLGQVLKATEAVSARLGRLQTWTVMASNVDADDAEAAARADRIRTLDARFREATAFLLPDLMRVGLDTVQQWIREHPALSDRERWLQRIRIQAPHVRSEEVEALLGALAGPFSGAQTAHSLLANAELDVAPAQDAQGREHAVTQSVIDTLREHPDRTLRKNAWTAYADAHLQRKRTMAALLVTGARQTNLLARTRGHDDALAMTLTPLEVPRAVVDQLLDTFREHLPVWHRFYEVKRRHLGLTRLQGWDVHAPVASDPPKVDYDEGLAWLDRSLAPLGSEYLATMRAGATHERWVDRAANDGKRMGAFSTGHDGTKPYIMMSWTGDLGSLSTLAHELGHSMHSYLSRRSQPYPYQGYTLFAAEVASNLHQVMLRDLLVRERADEREFQLALIDETISNIGRYLLIMPTLMRFELALHDRAERGGDLSADGLNDLCAELFAEAYGPAVQVDRERVGSTWAQFHTHLYSRFYVFMYATGIAGAHAVAKRLQHGGPAAAQAYLGFLRDGGRSAPLQALKRAGVDLTSPEPVRRAFEVLSRHVDRFEAWVENRATSA